MEDTSAYKGRRVISSHSRPRRADAVRNRAHLLSVARSAVLAGDIGISLEEVARRAGVGIGTLYRQFANRQELLEALYREEVGTLVELETTLTASATPERALREWLLAFVDVLMAKRIIGPALTAIIGPETSLPASGDTLKEAIRRLTARAASAGSFDPSLDPVDLLRALSGTIGIAVDDRASERARRMVDVLLAGVRPP